MKRIDYPVLPGAVLWPHHGSKRADVWMSIPASAATRYTGRHRMHHPALTLRRAVWIGCACVLLLSGVAAADASPAIDFDGDGRRDRFMLDRREPTVVIVWLSASDTTQVIRSRLPLARVVASDLDGDRRAELIARDSASHIVVWTRKRKQFRPFRPAGVDPVAFTHRHRRSLDDHHQDPLTAIASVPFVLSLRASSCAPRPSTSTARRPDRVCADRSLATGAPFAPRPPPTPVPL
jgi:hypothetical protein